MLLMISKDSDLKKVNLIWKVAQLVKFLIESEDFSHKE